LGELYTDLDNTKAISHLQNALTLAKSTADRMHISNKILEYTKPPHHEGFDSL
jgi:RNA polymerase sigma-70 factor (ECF subfamily)